MIDLKRIENAATVDQVLDEVLNAIHDIGGAYFARRRLEEEATGTSQYKLTDVLKKSMEEKALTDTQIEKYSLDVWEAAAMRLASFNGGMVQCHACAVEAEFGTEETPHPLPAHFHKCESE